MRSREARPPASDRSARAADPQALPRLPVRGRSARAADAQALPRLLVRGRRARLGALVAIGAGQAAAAVAGALLVRRAFDAAIAGGRGLSLSVAGLVATTLLAAWLRARERVVAERLGQGYVHAVRLHLFDRACAASPRALERGRHGTNTLRFAGDLNALRRWVSLGLARLLAACVFAAGALAGLAVLAPVLALAAGGVVACGTAGALLGARALHAAAVETRRRRARVAAHVGEVLAATAVIRGAGQVRRERERLRRRSRALRDASVAQARRAGQLLATGEATAGLAAAAVLVAGAAEVRAGRATPGTVVAAMTIAGLLVGALRDLGRVPEYHQTARASRAALLRFLGRLGPPAGGAARPRLPAGPGRVELRNVRVAGCFDALSATIEPGALVAVVGANGSGKSTLLAVLAGLERPDAGAVLIDGADVAACDAAGEIGLAGPDLPLLRGSVERNVRYRAPAADAAHVLELCGLAGAARRRVHERGRGLSSGERGRVELARALAGRPRLLLLDEPERTLDRAGMAVLDRVLASAAGSTTTIVATHHPAVLARADAVWQLCERELHVTATHVPARGARRGAWG